MFSSRPTPALETPTLPTMPASVIVSTRWPPGWSIVQCSQLPDSSSCQSQVCTPIGEPEAVALPSTATVEHSPRPAQSSSVRALSAPIRAGSRPQPEAMPAISSAR